MFLKKRLRDIQVEKKNSGFKFEREAKRNYGEGKSMQRSIDDNRNRVLVDSSSNQNSSYSFLPLQNSTFSSESEGENRRVSALRERERGSEATMITRSNLAEQLREYQIRSKHDWASISFFSSTYSNITTSRYA